MTQLRKYDKEKSLFLAELTNKKIDAIKSGLSPIEWLKTTKVYVTDNNGQSWNANEWYIAEKMEQYFEVKNDLFIQKVCLEIGIEKTMELLKQCNE